MATPEQSAALNPLVNEAFLQYQAELATLRTRLQQKDRVIRVLKAIIAESDPCIHVQMREFQESLARGEEGITLEELEARYTAEERGGE